MGSASRWFWIADLLTHIFHAVVDQISKMNGDGDSVEIKRAAARVIDPDRPEATLGEALGAPELKPPE